MRNSRLLIVFVSMSFISQAYAMAGNFAADVNYANSSVASSNQSIPHFNPTQFQHYTTNPTAAKYYQNGTSDADIKNDTPAALSNSAGGQTIETTFGKDQAFAVNPASPEITRSNIMQQDAYDVTHGISDQYIQCVAKSASCTTTYTQKVCTSSQTDHSCNTLITAGCSIINLQCTATFNHTCIQYQDTMSCPIKTCQNNAVICGAHSFCMNGNCYQPNPTQNQNFGKDEAQFAATSGAADSASQSQSIQAFGGNAMSCSLAPIGFLNCCANNGWGKNIHLASCSSQEKALGQDKENGYTIYIGTYCSHKILGICTQHRKSYCVFNGLLSKDVEQQGRVDQLGIGFGSSNSPNCNGLSVSQLQQINFSSIDFSNLEKSLQNQENFPNQKSIQQYIANKIKQEMGQK
ncbi:MAG: conjugal transfer protein TraN [Gammaproteobacteria bacterium]|nr:conjugal transfer protein TraN [Gammaproteobacteria bacterium]